MPDVLTYTLRQVRAYAEAADRARRRERAEQALDARAAQGVEPAKFEAYLKELTDG